MHTRYVINYFVFCALLWGNLRTDNMICFFLNLTEKANRFYKVICYIEWKKNWLIAKLCTHNFLHKKTPKHFFLTLCLSLSYYFNFDSLLYFLSIFKGWRKVIVGISITSYCCYKVLGSLSISNQWHFFVAFSSYYWGNSLYKGERIC